MAPEVKDTRCVIYARELEKEVIKKYPMVFLDIEELIHMELIKRAPYLLISAISETIASYIEEYKYCSSFSVEIAKMQSKLFTFELELKKKRGLYREILDKIVSITLKHSGFDSVMKNGILFIEKIR